MRVSLNWLKEYVDIDVGVDELARELTMLGLEIESIERLGKDIDEVYIGKILEIEQHPDADRLVVCKTDIGQAEPLQIVCGAKNMRVGDKVPTVVVGGTLPGGFKIGRRKMRGIESQGMMCSAKELGLGEDQEGLLILDNEMPLGEDAKPLLGLDDVVFEIEVTPNRGDWASMIGVAREIAALHGKDLRLPDVSYEEGAKPASDYSSVTIEDALRCPRYIGAILTHVKVGPSPLWMCQRLIAAGQRPINNIVDITNYVLMETGHPLHAFDYDKLAENRIVVRTAAPGELITTLDGEKRTLSEDMLVIADAKNPQAIAGIMGGGNSEVGEGTATLLLESAFFNPVSIRRTSRALGLATESSQRFQRGADPEMAHFAIRRAAALMRQLAGAEVAQGLLDAYPKPLETPKIRLRYARTDLVLGTTVAPENQRDILQKLSFQVLESDDKACTVRTPSWRHDVTLEADLIEEVARLHGYDKIQVSLPHIRAGEQVFAPHERTIRRLRAFLVGQGLTELVNWTFSCLEDVHRAGLDGEDLEMVVLENALSEKHATMRSSLIPGLLANTAHNIHHGAANVTTFEIGPVFRPNPDAELPDERPRLGIALSGASGSGHWSRPAESMDFYDIKGYAEAVFGFFNVQPTLESAGDPALFQPGQAATILHEGTRIGRLGKVGKTVRGAYDIEGDVYLLELDLEALLAVTREEHRFEAIPAFPASLRDMAVVVDTAVPAGALIETARGAGGKLLKSVEVFDIYTGKQVPAGKKSVALNLVFQSPERTLTDKDIQKLYKKILNSLRKAHGAGLR